eukprot:gene10750-22459_t
MSSNIFRLLYLLFVIASTGQCFVSMRPNRMINAKSPLKALNDAVLELCEENANIVIEEIREELGTIFGYDPKSREVGITGEISFVEVEGPVIVVALKGRFWHATDTIMLRIKSYISQRIPECIDVTLDRSKSQIVDDNDLNTETTGPKRLF